MTSIQCVGSESCRSCSFSVFTWIWIRPHKKRFLNPESNPVNNERLPPDEAFLSSEWNLGMDIEYSLSTIILTQILNHFGRSWKFEIMSFIFAIAVVRILKCSSVHILLGTCLLNLMILMFSKESRYWKFRINLYFEK